MQHLAQTPRPKLIYRGVRDAKLRHRLARNKMTPSMGAAFQIWLHAGAGPKSGGPNP